LLLNSTKIRILFLLNSTEIRGRRLLQNFMTKYTECMKVMCELYKWNMLQVWGGPGL
jgi:hypothetical protein